MVCYTYRQCIDGLYFIDTAIIVGIYGSVHIAGSCCACQHHIDGTAITIWYKNLKNPEAVIDLNLIITPLWCDKEKCLWFML